jgi:predicted Fe-Mo cluster-binding NifX family protein
VVATAMTMEFMRHRTIAHGSQVCEAARKISVELLAGCRAVICGGIGTGAANALAAHGVESLVVADRLTVEAAVAQYLAGTLVTTQERVCLCG